MRVFLAIPIPQIISHKLQLLLRSKRESWEVAVDGHLNFVASKNYHITLKFCGEVADNKISDIIHIVQKSIAEHKPFQLETTAIAPIPYHRPRIIGLDIRQNQTCNTIQKQISDLLDMSGLLKTTTFGTKPLHLTLARIKGDVISEDITPIPFQETVAVSTIILYQSILKEDGPHYKPLETFIL